MTEVEETQPTRGGREPVGGSASNEGHDPTGSNADLPEHPTGTLAIVLVYATLFAITWAWVYFDLFLGRGALTS